MEGLCFPPPLPPRPSSDDDPKAPSPPHTGCLNLSIAEPAASTLLQWREVHAKVNSVLFFFKSPSCFPRRCATLSGTLYGLPPPPPPPPFPPSRGGCAYTFQTSLAFFLLLLFPARFGKSGVEKQPFFCVQIVFFSTLYTTVQPFSHKRKDNKVAIRSTCL